MQLRVTGGVTRCMSRWLVVGVLLAVAGCAGDGPRRGGERDFAGAIAMPDAFSADAAEAVLRRGGNAVDAAVTAAFVLAVTMPEAGNIGGGGFMLVRFDDRSEFLDYRETAPAGAHRDLYLDDDGNVVAGASTIGHRAAGVPGTVAGLWAAHQRYGTLPWPELVAPAVRLAEDGFVVPEELARRVAEELPGFEGHTNFADYFGGLRVDRVFRQPQLATTLKRIAARGQDDFYRGRTAKLIAADMAAHGGLITEQDLEGYHVAWREPLEAAWRGFEVVSAPPPSSGGFGVIQLLKMKAHLDDAFAGAPINSTRYVHLVAEMQKRVFADRADYLGDADFVDVPMDALLDPDYIRRRADEVDPSAISEPETVRPGLTEGVHTTHFSIVDADGNAVANSYTLNTSFGSGVVVEGAGFLLNNEMDDFSAKPGTRNVYGLMGDETNAIAPGKRPLSSMAPTLLLEDGAVRMVVGTPGGSTIFGSVFLAIAAIVDGGWSPARAVAAPLFHHQLRPPDLVTYTPGTPLPPATIMGLEAMGYRVRPHAWEFGDLQVVYFDGEQWLAASDPRHRGVARVLTR